MTARHARGDAADRTAQGIDRMLRNVETGRFERSLSALTAAGALVTAAEIYFEHDSASFGNKMMWLPVALGPVGAAAGLAGFFSRRMAKTALPITFTSFADAGEADRVALVRAVQDLKSADWHGLPAAHVWSLWTRYACTAFYAHPSAWAEIGFPGPAYPRGYKNAGVGKLEPFEVGDAQPAEDPVRGGS